VYDRRRSRSSPDAPPADLLRDLWLAKKLLELVCSFGLASVAHKYTSTLDVLAWSTSMEEASASQKSCRAEFMEAARRELGIQGPHLYRTSGADVVGEDVL
jgi:hypothetical protein